MAAATELRDEVLRLEGRVRALETLLAVLVARLPDAIREAALASLAGIETADATGGLASSTPEAQDIVARVREGMRATAEEIRRNATILAPERPEGP